MDAGYTTCCTDNNCEVASVDLVFFTCFCDATCHVYGDCCNDIDEIGCTKNNGELKRIYTDHFLDSLRDGTMWNTALH